MTQEDLIKLLGSALQDASDHLDYCGYGDKWEREGTEPLQNKIAHALATFGNYPKNIEKSSKGGSR